MKITLLHTIEFCCNAMRDEFGAHIRYSAKHHSVCFYFYGEVGDHYIPIGRCPWCGAEIEIGEKEEK